MRRPAGRIHNAPPISPIAQNNTPQILRAIVANAIITDLFLRQVSQDALRPSPIVTTVYVIPATSTAPPTSLGVDAQQAHPIATLRNATNAITPGVSLSADVVAQAASHTATRINAMNAQAIQIVRAIKILVPIGHAKNVLTVGRK